MSLIYSNQRNVPQFFDKWDGSTSGLSLVNPEIKNGVAVDFQSPERLSDNRTMGCGS